MWAFYSVLYLVLRRCSILFACKDVSWHGLTLDENGLVCEMSLLHVPHKLSVLVWQWNFYESRLQTHSYLYELLYFGGTRSIVVDS